MWATFLSTIPQMTTKILDSELKRTVRVLSPNFHQAAMQDGTMVFHGLATHVWPTFWVKWFSFWYKMLEINIHEHPLYHAKVMCHIDNSLKIQQSWKWSVILMNLLVHHLHSNSSPIITQNMFVFLHFHPGRNHPFWWNFDPTVWPKKKQKNWMTGLCNNWYMTLKYN